MTLYSVVITIYIDGVVMFSVKFAVRGGYPSYLLALLVLSVFVMLVSQSKRKTNQDPAHLQKKSEKLRAQGDQVVEIEML